MKEPFKSSRRTFVKKSVLGVLGAMSVPALLESCSNAASREEISEDVTAGTNPCATDISDHLKKNIRFTVCASFETQGEIQIATGHGNETVAVKVAADEKDAFSWWYKKPDASDPDAFEYQGIITVGGRGTPAFGWTDKVLEWTDFYNRIREENPLAKRKFYITLENHEGFGRFFINGLLMHEWLVMQSYDYSSCKVTTIDGATVVAPTEMITMADGDERYWPMDISSRYNAKSIAGETVDKDSLPLRNVVFKVNGIPFIIGSSALDGNNHLDIGRSWFREGNLFGTYEEPHAGSFGGRWIGVHSDNPTRFQFRLPNRAPKAIHLLAFTDGRENSIPRLTAQFYRVAAGFPVDIVSPEIPLATAKADAKKCWPVRMSSGTTYNLWQVTIPVNPGLLQQLSCHDEPDRKYYRVNQLTDRDMLEVEFTKDTSVYRMYPDPCYYSSHGAGLPSSVRLFAASMEYPAVEVKFEPDAYGNIRTEPAVPSYTVLLTNKTNKATSIKLLLSSISHSGTEKLKENMRIKLTPYEVKNVTMHLPVKRFGHHDLTLKVVMGKEETVIKRSLSHLRKREHEARPFDARGFMFGYWNWQGTHATPNADEEILLMGPLGMESAAIKMSQLTEEEIRFMAPISMDHWAIETSQLSKKGEENAVKYGMKCFYALSQVGGRNYSIVRDRFGADPDIDRALVDVAMKKMLAANRNPQIFDPTYSIFFAEPGGLGTHGTLPEFYGEENAFTTENREQFKMYHDAALELTKVMHKHLPGLKILIPWGDICFAIPFLEKNDELTELMDGVAVDFAYFDRLPEMQFHQSVLHRCYQFKTYWDKYKPGKRPVLTSVEGPCISPVMAGALTPQLFADHTIRAALMLAGYGVTRQFAMCTPVETSNMWGEQHYGGGVLSRLPELNPHICYSAMGTLIRHLRWMEFEDWKPTGSLSVFCHHYRDSKTAKDLFVLWTVRGKRKVTMTIPAGAKPELYDSMDNLVPLSINDDKIGFTIDPSPLFLYGSDDTAKIELGAPDHSDVVPNAYTKSLGYMAELLHQDMSPDVIDYHYTHSFPDAIRRFPAEMKVERLTATRKGAKRFPALSIDLPSQPKARDVMPYFTTFVLDHPVEIPGKASHLSLWVKGASDWGRIVYVLRDAKDEQWISVGTIGEWNCDDMPCESYFNFDGWRLLRFEMPSHSPYDRFREAGTIWWGSMGNGDGIVDLPLKLEKVYVERRAKAMYVNSLEPTDPSPVLLGELIAEYASPDEMGVAAITRDGVVMPSPPEGFKRSNPIAELMMKGELKATRMVGVEHPSAEPNGRHGVFTFDEMADAVTYDIWVSTHPDGSGALHLGKDIKNTGAIIRGTRPNWELYAFVVYKDRNGRLSKPSEPFKFKLDSQFGNR